MFLPITPTKVILLHDSIFSIMTDADAFKAQIVYNISAIIA